MGNAFSSPYVIQLDGPQLFPWHAWYDPLAWRVTEAAGEAVWQYTSVLGYGVPSRIWQLTLRVGEKKPTPLVGCS
jgi:hypothetical protein